MPEHNMRVTPNRVFRDLLRTMRASLKQPRPPIPKITPPKTARPLPTKRGHPKLIPGIGPSILPKLGHIDLNPMGPPPPEPPSLSN